MEKFIIVGPKDDNEQLYWSDIDGWGDKNSATEYTKKEINNMYYPMETVSIETIIVK